MSFVDVPKTTVVEREIDPALADRIEAGRMQGASRLRSIREDRQLSTADLARLSGLTHDEILALESGQPFDPNTLQAVSAALDVPAEMLMD